MVNENISLMFSKLENFFNYENIRSPKSQATLVMMLYNQLNKKKKNANKPLFTVQEVFF